MQTTMQIKINAIEQGQQKPNFWNNIHFHPTDAVEDIWGQDILDKLAADGSARYVRLYTMFEDVVTRDEEGKLVFDFSAQDVRLDYMVSKGYKLLMCFNFMPVVMAKTPTELSGCRYKDKRFCRSNPADYDEWRQLCQAQAQHWVDRYGVDEVSQWLFHCWNEPDLGFWIYPQFFFELTKEKQDYKIDEYCKLYDYFEAGVHAVSPRLQVGGPSCGHYKDFFRRVMEHVSSGKNYVTGAKGTRIDFVSMHCYSSIPQDVHDPLRHRICPESIVNQYCQYRSIMAECGLGELPAVIDEWAAAAEGYLGIKEMPRMRFRETEYYSAFYFRLIDLMRQLSIPPMRMMICLSGQDHNTEDFDGHRTFFTARGWRKPIANAFAMAAKLGEEAIPCEISCDSPDAGAFATRRKDGAIVIALYNHVWDFGREGEPVPVSFNVCNLPEHFTVRRYRIDQVFSNAYTAWGRLNCPSMPTVWEREQISRRARLEKCRSDEKGANAFVGETLLTPNSVELIEIVGE
ncbi:MAG: hypothetical protein IJS08_12535 [Victivallales bacterium]|nr:hypothetical protein [Victivallales bacterium]